MLAVGISVNGDVSHLPGTSKGYNYDAPAASEINKLTDNMSAPKIDSLQYLPPIINSIENTVYQPLISVI